MRSDNKRSLLSLIERVKCNLTGVELVQVGDQFGESVHFRPFGENNALRGGDQRLLRGVYVGHHERSGAAIFLTPDACEKSERELREWWNTRDGIACSDATCVGVPWQLRPDQRNLVRPGAEAEQGVALDAGSSEN